MAYKKSETKKIPAPRQGVEFRDYEAVRKADIKWYVDHNIHIVKLERTDFQATGGIRWIATVEVGHQSSRLTPLVMALKVVATNFGNVYQPSAWELRGSALPTFEISWFTNPPSF